MVRYEVKRDDGVITGHHDRTSAYVQLGRVAESHYRETGRITRVSEVYPGTLVAHEGRDDTGPDMILRAVAVAYRVDR